MTVRTRSTTERTHGWCPDCKEDSAISADGNCLWCGTPARLHAPKTPKPGGWKRPDLHGSRYTEAQIRALHLAHQRGASLNELGRKTHEQVGYKSAGSAAMAISREFKRLGLLVRDRIEQTVLSSTKHGRKRRGRTNAQEVEYRHWLAKQRGWRAVQGPGNPICKAVRNYYPRKGEPCQHAAMDDSEFCAQHDPRHAEALNERLAAARARQPVRPMVSIDPLAAWLARRHDELGSWRKVAASCGVHQTTVRDYSLRRDGNKRPKRKIGVETVTRLLEADGTTTFAELYQPEERST